MVLKRLMIGALGALGLGALAAGSAFADEIPPPKTFGGQNLAGCLMPAPGPKDPPPRKKVSRDPGFSTSSDSEALIKDITLFMELAGCAEVSLGTGGAKIDLSDAIADAREAYEDLPDKDDSDYQVELDTFNKEYAGSIFSVLAKEIDAQMAVEEAQDDFDDGIGALFTDGAVDLLGADATTTLDALYRGLTLSAKEEGEDAEEAVSIPTVAGIAIARDGDGGVTVDFTGSFDTTASGTDDVDFGTSDDIGSLLGLRQTSLDAIADAEEALAGHVAEDYDFTSRQLDEIDEFKEIHELRVKRLDDAIKTIRSDASTTETLVSSRDVDDVIRDYDDALGDIGDALEDGLDDRTAHNDAKKAVTAEFRNPISLLEAVINVADKDLQRAVARGDDEEDLVPLRVALANARAAKQAYDDAVADTDNPASALLTSLVAGDDTGQALLDAVSANHGSTVANAEDIAALGDNTVEVAANSTKNAEQDVLLEGLDGRVTVNTMGIATNAAEIVRVEGRVDTNWDAIAVNQMGIADNTGRIDANEMGISMNSGRIDAAETMIGQNEQNISGNTAMIGELSESLEVVRAGVAASMALAGMPAINGRGISIGVGSFDGESAFAIGFQIQNEATSFKVGLTSGGGATGASAGVGFQF